MRPWTPSCRGRAVHGRGEPLQDRAVPGRSRASRPRCLEQSGHARGGVRVPEDRLVGPDRRGPRSCIPVLPYTSARVRARSGPRAASPCRAPRRSRRPARPRGAVGRRAAARLARAAGRREPQVPAVVVGHRARIIAYTRSRSASASRSRFEHDHAASLAAYDVPSASASNGRHRPVGEIAPILLRKTLSSGATSG